MRSYCLFTVRGDEAEKLDFVLTKLLKVVGRDLGECDFSMRSEGKLGIGSGAEEDATTILSEDSR